MALLDDLKGILSDAEYQKLVGNQQMKTRLERGDELRSYYEGDDPAPATTTTTAATAEDPATRTAERPALDLTGIERMLDSKLSKMQSTIDAEVEKRVNTIIEQRGNELVTASSNLALSKADELNRVYNRHFADFGEQFDSAAFNDFLNKPENSVMGADGKRTGSKFQSVTQAYDAMTHERRVQKQIQDGIAAGVKASTSGQSVAGTTPPPSMNSNIRVLMARGRQTADGQPATRSERAASALDRLTTRAQEAAS